MNNPHSNDSKGSKPSLSLLNPSTILNNAIRAVPAVKFALGVAGIGAAVALVAGIITDYRVAVLGIVLMFGFMTVLVVFSALARSAGSLGTLALLLAWAFVILIIVTAFLMLTSFFFHWPQPLSNYVSAASTSPSPTPTPVAPTPSLTPNITDVQGSYKGRVIDGSTNAALPNVTVIIEVDNKLPQSARTDSDGIFQFAVTGKNSVAFIRIKADGYVPVEKQVNVPSNGIEPIPLSRPTPSSRRPRPSKTPCSAEDVLLGKCKVAG